MRPVAYREVKRKLEAAGFTEVGQSGSHVKFAKIISESRLTAIVPKHRDVAAGTIRSILRQARLSLRSLKGYSMPRTVTSVPQRYRLIYYQRLPALF